MKKLYLLLLLGIIVCTTQAQQISFEEHNPLAANAVFQGVQHGSIAISDVDGDNDADVLITGLIGYYIGDDRISQLYTNDGNGNFTLVPNTPFEGVWSSSIAFADVDGDNDADVLITGFSGSEEVSRLYTNDGSGNFSLVPNTPFEGVYDGSIAFADVDGDNDADVLITGGSNAEVFSKFYTNDGDGNFTFVPNTPFEGVYDGSIAFADVDGDNDADVLITGYSGSEEVSRLYTNDGNGNFTLVPNTPFEGVRSGSIAFADVDGDNDADVLITGYSNGVAVSRLYTNDGNGRFTLVPNTPFEGVFDGSISFADVDGDNDADVLITGYSNGEAVSRLYTNGGNGNFTLVPNPPFEGVWSSSVAFADVDNNNSPDLFITGLANDNRIITKLYLNTGSSFSEPAPKTLPNIGKGSVKVLKLNGITYLQITGAEDFGESKALLYKIQNGGIYEVSNKTLDIKNAQTIFEDFDGNGFPDIFLAGGVDENEEVQPPVLLSYENGSYAVTPISGLPTLEQVRLSYADILANGKKQFLLSGFDEQFDYKCFLYQKTGGAFNKLNINFAALKYGFQKVLDLNNDGKNDVVISGSDSNFNNKTLIYINKGGGTFETKSNGTSNPIGKPLAVDLGDFAPNHAEFFDLDNNGTLDMIAGGYNDNFDPLVKVFLNDGDANFSELNGHQLSQLSEVFLVQSDINEDGNIDLLLTGQDENGTQLTELYTNDGTGTFTKVASVDFGSFYPSSALFTDINDDSKPDLVISGENEFYEPITKFFINTSDYVSGVTSFEGFNTISYASPNPSQGRFNLDFGQKTADEVVIFDSQGKIVAKYSDIQKMELNLQVPAGLYFIQVLMGTKVHSEKIVIE